MCTKNKNLLTSYLAFFFFLFCFSSTALGTENVKKKLETIKSRMAQTQSKINQKREQKQAVYQQIVKIQRNIVYTDIQLQNTTNSVRYYSTLLDHSKNTLSQIDQRYKEKQKVFDRRLLAFYKNQKLGVLELFLNGQDFLNIVESSFYVEKVVQTDVSLFNQLRKDQQSRKREAQLLTFRTDKLNQLKGQISEQQQRLYASKAEKAKFQAALDKEIRQYEREQDQLQRESEQISAMIRRSVTGQVIRPGTGRFIMPTAGWISSEFGYRFHPIFRVRKMHSGVDIAAPYGQPIRASDSGQVIFAGQIQGYGKTVIIDHGHNYSTVYGHQSRIVVSSGERVSQGQLIGYVGKSGYATGPHLHFEIRFNQVPINPRTRLSF